MLLLLQGSPCPLRAPRRVRREGPRQGQELGQAGALPAVQRRRQDPDLRGGAHQGEEGA